MDFPKIFSTKAPSEKPGSLILPAIGVDIGSSAVRAVRVTKINNDGYAIVDRLAIVQLKPDIVKEGRIKNAVYVGRAVNKALETLNSSKNVVIGIASPQQSISRNVLSTVISPPQRLSVIRTTVDTIGSNLSVSDAQLAINYVRRERKADDSEVAALLIAGVHNDAYEAIENVCIAADIVPRATDLSGVGTLRAVVRDEPESSSFGAVVDIGATTTTIMIREGLRLHSIRVIPEGGASLTKALQGTMKGDLIDVERKKLSMSIPIAAPKEVGSSAATSGLALEGMFSEDDEYRSQLAAANQSVRAVAEAAERLVDTIAASIESDVSQMGVNQTPHVALTGGTSMMAGLREALDRRINADVNLAAPWALLEQNKYNAPYMTPAGLGDPGIMGNLTTAVGLSLWRPMP